MTAEKRQFLSSLLEVSLQKMKWDVDTDVDDLDDDDRGAFDQMRKVGYFGQNLCYPRFLVIWLLGSENIHGSHHQHRRGSRQLVHSTVFHDDTSAIPVWRYSVLAGR